MSSDPPRAAVRMLALILEAQERIRPLPEGEWGAAIAAERKLLLDRGEAPWLAAHIGYCLEERMLRRHKGQGCGASLSGGHECVLDAVHNGRSHRCACSREWPRL